MSLQAKSCFVFKTGKWIPMNFHEVRVVCDTCGRFGPYLAEVDLNAAVHKVSLWATEEKWQCVTDQQFCRSCQLTPEGIGI